MHPPARVPDWQPDRGLLMRPSPRDSNDHRRRPAALPLQRAALMMRSVPVTMLVVLLMAGGAARAQGTGGTLPNGTTVAFDKLYIHENGSKDAIQPKVDPDSKWKYFNLAHCQCSKAQPNFVESTYEYLLTSAGSAT